MSGPAPEKPDLARPRAAVLAAIAGSPMSAAPHVRAPAPLRPLAPEIEAKLAARTLPAGGDRDADVGKVVVPCAVLAVLDAVALVVAAVTGHPGLAIVAGLLFVPLAGLAVIGAGMLRRDTVRLTLADRRAMAAASRWDSKQAWTGPLAGGQERGLVIAAARVAERIARSSGWQSGALSEHRIRLDLISTLDEIDDQAHRIAVARQQQPGGPAGTDPAVDVAWDAAVDRVAALTAYADSLDGLAAAQAAAITRLGGDPVRDEGLLTGSAQDQFALEQLYALSLYLNAGGGAFG
jgi:hypothetical protein